MYRIKDWVENFETAKTIDYNHCARITFPNKLNDPGYIRLVKGKSGAAYFGVWIAICEYHSSQSKPREGYLTHNGKDDGMPLDSDEIAELVRLDQKIVSDAISRLNDPKIGWIEEIPVEVGVRSDQGDIIGDNDRSYTPHHTTPHHSNMLPPVAPTSKKQIYPESFERLWKIHPKGNKKPAYRKFRAINPGDDLLTEMMTNVVAFQKSEQWRNGYAQDLSRWLNEEGWANFPPESHQETTAEMERRLNAENSG